MSKKSAAEPISTFRLVLGGCGSVVFAAAYRQDGIGFAAISLAFGLALLTTANPACRTGSAVFLFDWAPGPLRLFRVAPIVGAQGVGCLCRWLGREE